MKMAKGHNAKTVGRRRQHNLSYPQHLHNKAGWFYYVFLYKGERKWLPLKTRDLPEALRRWGELEAYYKDKLQQFDLKAAVDNHRSITFHELATRFLDEVAVHNSPKTLMTYKRMAEALSQEFGNKQIVDLTRQEVTRYHDSIRDKPYEANRRVGLVRLILQKALDWGYLTVNVTDKIKKFKEKRHKLKLTAEILFEELYPVAQPMLKRAILLAFHLVQHEHEVKSLQWSHFDFKKKTVSFNRQKTDEAIVIDYSGNPAFEAFLSSLKRRDFNPYLISRPSARGWMPYSHFRSLWASALVKAGYEKGQFKFKEIRHLANTLLKQGNITADKRMAMTGHKTIQANEVYTHPTGTDTVEAGRVLSQYGPPKK